jgi:hypothetical protein
MIVQRKIVQRAYYRRSISTREPRGLLGESSANRKLAYTGLLLGKKSRLRGRILRVAKVAQADANQAKPLVRPEADTF